MFRRRYRRHGGIFRGILALIIFSAAFSGGIGTLFAFGNNRNDPGGGRSGENNSSSYTGNSSSTEAGFSPAIPSRDDDTSTPFEISSPSPSETTPKVEEIKEIEPNEQNSLTVQHHENVRFEGKVTEGKTTTFKFTAPVTGKYWLTFEKVYSGDCFDIKVLDQYGNDKAFFSSSSDAGGGNADLEKNVEYTIAIEDYYGNNKHNTFAVVVMIPDEIVDINPGKVFIYDDIRYTNQVLEYSFTPAESGYYSLSYECSSNVHLDRVGFIDDYGYENMSYGSKDGTVKAELEDGKTVRICVFNYADHNHTGKIKLKLIKEENIDEDNN